MAGQPTFVIASVEVHDLHSIHADRGAVRIDYISEQFLRERNVG